MADSDGEQLKADIWEAFGHRRPPRYGYRDIPEAAAVQSLLHNVKPAKLSFDLIETMGIPLADVPEAMTVPMQLYFAPAFMSLCLDDAGRATGFATEMIGWFRNPKTADVLFDPTLTTVVRFVEGLEAQHAEMGLGVARTSFTALQEWFSAGTDPSEHVYAGQLTAAETEVFSRFFEFLAAEHPVRFGLPDGEHGRVTAAAAAMLSVKPDVATVLGATTPEECRRLNAILDALERHSLALFPARRAEPIRGVLDDAAESSASPDAVHPWTVVVDPAPSPSAADPVTAAVTDSISDEQADLIEAIFDAFGMREAPRHAFLETESAQAVAASLEGTSPKDLSFELLERRAVKEGDLLPSMRLGMQLRFAPALMALAVLDANRVRESVLEIVGWLRPKVGGWLLNPAVSTADVIMRLKQDFPQSTEAPGKWFRRRSRNVHTEKPPALLAQVQRWFSGDYPPNENSHLALMTAEEIEALDGFLHYLQQTHPNSFAVGSFPHGVMVHAARAMLCTEPMSGLHAHVMGATSLEEAQRLVAIIGALEREFPRYFPRQRTRRVEDELRRFADHIEDNARFHAESAVRKAKFLAEDRVRFPAAGITSGSFKQRLREDIFEAFGWRRPPRYAFTEGDGGNVDAALQLLAGVTPRELSFDLIGEVHGARLLEPMTPSMQLYMAPGVMGLCVADLHRVDSAAADIVRLFRDDVIAYSLVLGRTVDLRTADLERVVDAVRHRDRHLTATGLRRWFLEAIIPEDNPVIGLMTTHEIAVTHRFLAFLQEEHPRKFGLYTYYGAATWAARAILTGESTAEAMGVTTEDEARNLAHIVARLTEELRGQFPPDDMDPIMAALQKYVPSYEARTVRRRAGKRPPRPKGPVVIRAAD